MMAMAAWLETMQKEEREEAKVGGPYGSGAAPVAASEEEVGARFCGRGGGKAGRPCSFWLGDDAG
jgi:hypothetical protein